MVHELTGHGEAGGRYVETWRLTEGGYEWRLETGDDGPRERVMGGCFRRVP